MIYCIGNRKRGICKIGFTTREVAARLKELQPSNDYDLTIFGEIDGRRAEENALHKRLKPHQVAGEWFTLCTEIAEVFGFRLDEPDHLWATYIKFYRCDGDMKYYTSVIGTHLAPTKGEALVSAIAKARKRSEGSIIEQIAWQIADEVILEAAAGIGERGAGA